VEAKVKKVILLLVLAMPMCLAAQTSETQTSNKDVAIGIAEYLIASEISLTEENRAILESIIEVILDEADRQADSDIRREREVIDRLTEEIERRKNFGIGAGVTVAPDLKLQFSVSMILFF
jgi:hypothetical protein